MLLSPQFNHSYNFPFTVSNLAKKGQIYQNELKEDNILGVINLRTMVGNGLFFNLFFSSISRFKTIIALGYDTLDFYGQVRVLVVYTYANTYV